MTNNLYGDGYIAGFGDGFEYRGELASATKDRYEFSGKSNSLYEDGYREGFGDGFKYRRELSISAKERFIAGEKITSLYEDGYRASMKKSIADMRSNGFTNEDISNMINLPLDFINGI